jgi:hypothetical protein
MCVFSPVAGVLLQHINIKWVLKEGSAFPVSLVSPSKAHFEPP